MKSDLNFNNNTTSSVTDPGGSAYSVISKRINSFLNESKSKVLNLSTFRYMLKLILPIQRIWREKVQGYDWFSKVNDNLFIGGALTKNSDYEWLAKGKIDAVLNVCIEWDDDEEDLADVDIDYLKLHVPDFSSPSINQIKSGIRFISSHAIQGKRVLVHCAKGRGRSATIVCAYLMHENVIRFSDAQKMLKISRSLVSLSPCQIDTLIELERFWSGIRSLDIRRNL